MSGDWLARHQRYRWGIAIVEGVQFFALALVLAYVVARWLG